MSAGGDFHVFRVLRKRARGTCQGDTRQTQGLPKETRREEEEEEALTVHRHIP